jgi:hypothetical protein
MKPADFDQLSDSERQHFYKCEKCGEMVDMRQLEDVLFHEDHVHKWTAGIVARDRSYFAASNKVYAFAVP